MRKKKIKRKESSFLFEKSIFAAQIYEQEILRHRSLNKFTEFLSEFSIY